MRSLAFKAAPIAALTVMSAAATMPSQRTAASTPGVLSVT
jgi:hypothetical protein